MKTKPWLLALLIVLLAPASFGAIPKTMSYQGVLKNVDGTLVPDGNYSMTFRLYTVSTGGSALWTETQTAAVSGGIFNVILGSQTALGLAFDVQYWLGVSVGSEAEMTPRVALASAPYGFRAAMADSAVRAPGLTLPYHATTSSSSTQFWITNNGTGSAAYFENTGNSYTPALYCGSGSSGGAIRASHTSGNNAQIATSNSGVTGNSGTDIGVKGYATGGATGVFGTNVTAGNYGHLGSPSYGVYGYSSTGYAGYFDGNVQMTGFKLPTGASAGKVLTSDASGLGTWQWASGGSDGDWTIAGNNMYSAVSGNVGIGTTQPKAKLDVNSMVRVTGSVTWPQSGTGLELGYDTSAHTGYIQAYNRDTQSYGVLYLGRGTVILDAPISIWAGTNPVGEFKSTSTYPYSHIVYAEYNGSGGSSHVDAVYGKSIISPNHGYGGYFEGGRTGVAARAEYPGGSSHTGLHAQATGATVANIGVYAWAGATATENYAAWLDGHVVVNGTLFKAGGGFKIDHPLDPTRQYLYHSFVESPDMMNIYNGNVTLDGNGEASVALPDWFEAVNGDCRYQLTPIGQPGPNLYVAQGVSGNRFNIAGGTPGAQVSWQVTGIRRDAYAQAHRIPVEAMKPAHEQGLLLHPDLFGQPETQAVGYEQRQEVVRE
jgi:hypothetical protein